MNKSRNCESNSNRRVLFFAILFTLPAIAFACYANGICGGYGFCQPMMPAAPMMCNCGPGYGCGQYGCYRMRARASKSYKPGTLRSRLVNYEDGDEGEIVPQYPDFDDSLRSRNRLPSSKSRPLTELDEHTALARASPTAADLPNIADTFRDPNQAFLECCMDRQLPDSCLNKCNFNTYNRRALTAMYFRQDACPMAAMKEMQFCAAQGRDHRGCCLRNGVGTTIAGRKCLTFCDQRPGIITQLDMSYLPCFDRFESIKGCFWQDIMRYFRR